MLYIRKTNEEVKDFVAIKFNEYFQSTQEERNLRKVNKQLHIFLKRAAVVEKYVKSSSSDNCIDSYNVEILNTFDPELQLLNTKPMIKNKLKELLNEFKKF